jgi:hypothetical protein
MEYAAGVEEVLVRLGDGELDHLAALELAAAEGLDPAIDAAAALLEVPARCPNRDLLLAEIDDEMGEVLAGLSANLTSVRPRIPDRAQVLGAIRERDMARTPALIVIPAAPTR